MNLREKKKYTAEIFTSAMNDIMFFLMLFFIIISTLLNPSVIKINLPNAKNTQSISKREISLTVTHDLNYYVNKQPVTLENLEVVLNREIAGDDDAVIMLRVDNSISVQQLVKVMEIGNKLKVKMALATKQNALL